MWSKQQLLKARRSIRLAAVSLPDELAWETPELFAPWEADHDYTKGDRVRCGNKLYKLIPETYRSQAEHTPDLIPAVWARMDDPAEEWPEWVQPLGTEDAYPAGAKVTHSGKRWLNTYGDYNIWEPGVFGWEQKL